MSQAAFLNKHFNCGQAEFSAHESLEDEDSTFLASDVDSEYLLSESGSDALGESGLLRVSDDERPSASEHARRSYQPRSASNTAVFAGRHVCLRAYRSLLGVGETTLQRLRHGELVYTNKDRTPTPKHPSFGFALRGETAAKWMNVVMFMWYVYHSSAEYMPDNFRAVTKDVSFQDIAESQDEDIKLRAVNSFMKTLHSQSTDVDVHTIGPGTFQGDRRALPYGSRTEMFWEYRAYCSAIHDQPASFSTFMRIAKCVIGPAQKNGHLKFRKINEHAKCDDCVRLKKALRAKALQGEDRREQQRAYMRHILSQWLDRQLYWQFRSMSQTYFRQAVMASDRRGFLLCKLAHA